MVMASLAWTLKAWFALLLPEKGRWKEKYRQQKQQVQRMEFERFVNSFIRLPCQIVRSGRRIVYRLLSWNPWVDSRRRGTDAPVPPGLGKGSSQGRPTTKNNPVYDDGRSGGPTGSLQQLVVSHAPSR